MAKTLKTYTFQKDRLGCGRPSLYPWDDFTNGEIWKAVAGTDFQTSLNGFRSTLTAHAKRKGYILKADVHKPTSVSPGYVVFQFIKTNKPAAVRKTTTRRRRTSVR